MVRPIALLSHARKLYEQCILIKLQEIVKMKDLLHSNQRGFRSGVSCETNIQDLVGEMEELKQTQLQYRREKIPTNQRRRAFVLFIDLKQAFDRVNRSKLVQKLRSS